MDPVSLAPSIEALGGTVIQIQQNAKNVEGSKADMNRLCGELLAMKGALEHIQSLVQPSIDGPARSQPDLKNSEDVSNIFRSSQFGDIMKDLIRLLEDLQERLGKPKGPLRTAWDRFVWPSSKAAIGSHIARIERAKTCILMAMLGNNIESFPSIHQEVKDLITRLDEEKSERLKKALLKHLAPVNSARAHVRACNAHLSETGVWFLRDHRFHTWCNGPQASAIWLWGKPGAGKTTMISSVIEHTASLAVQKNNAGVAYFYCTFNSAASQEPRMILRSVIAQLARQKPSLLSGLENYFKGNKTKISNRTLGNWEEILWRCSAYFDRVYIFIDAINESRNRISIGRSISKIAKSSGNVSVFLTSIEETIDPTLQESLPSTVIAMRSNEISADVEKVIDSGLQHRFGHLKLSNSLKDKIRSTLVGQADGMYVIQIF